MECFALKNRVRLKASRTPEDPEKCVLPTIVFVNTNHPAFEQDRHRGFVIFVGWWDWSVKFGMFI